MGEDRLIRHLFMGFIQVHILHHAAEEDIYGSEFQNELARHGYEVSFGTLYPIFHRLEKDGYIDSYKKIINGKVRKYYTITPQGRNVLKEARIKAGELFREISEQHD
jgi:DNA-binding PadR family transcriptional regulator